MSEYNSVVWSQGLFLKPEHFQQQQRSNHYQRNGHVTASNSYRWGLSCLEIQDPALSQGQFAVSRVSGVMPDGMVFDTSIENCLPDSLSIKSFSSNLKIYIAINRTRSDTVEVGNEKPHARRYTIGASTARDNSLGFGSETVGPQDTIDVAIPNLILVTAEDNLSDLDCLPIASIRDIDSEGNVILDTDFVPVSMSILCSDYLLIFVNRTLTTLDSLQTKIDRNIHGVENNDEVLVSNTHHGAFPLFLLTRRYIQRFRHSMSLPVFHPVDLYLLTSELLAELSCFTRDEFPEKAMIGYDHANPSACFHTLFPLVDQNLSALIDGLDAFTGAASVVEPAVAQEDKPKQEIVTPKVTPSVPPW